MAQVYWYPRWGGWVWAYGRIGVRGYGGSTGTHIGLSFVAFSCHHSTLISLSNEQLSKDGDLSQIEASVSTLTPILTLIVLTLIVGCGACLGV